MLKFDRVAHRPYYHCTGADPSLACAFEDTTLKFGMAAHAVCTINFEYQTLGQATVGLGSSVPCAFEDRNLKFDIIIILSGQCRVHAS